MPVGKPAALNNKLIPSASNARCIALRLFGSGMISPRSKAATVRKETVAFLARSLWSHPSQPRAARDCAGVNTPVCRDIPGEDCRILLDLGNVAC